MTHSSTSNSDYHLHYHTPTISWRAALWLAIPLWMLALGVWEWFWRHQGYEPSYLNSVGLWADARRKVGTDGNRDLVIVGSSRILFDLDLNVLSEELDAPYPIQLALEGTNPYDFLHDIAVDPLFVVRNADGLYGLVPDRRALLIMRDSGLQLRKHKLDKVALPVDGGLTIRNA